MIKTVFVDQSVTPDVAIRLRQSGNRLVDVRFKQDVPKEQWCDTQILASITGKQDGEQKPTVKTNSNKSRRNSRPQPSKSE